MIRDATQGLVIGQGEFIPRCFTLIGDCRKSKTRSNHRTALHALHKIYEQTSNVRGCMRAKNEHGFSDFVRRIFRIRKQSIEDRGPIRGQNLQIDC